MTKVPSAGGWSRSVPALCSPKDQQHTGNTLRGSEGFVPALCVADGADNTGETTTINTFSKDFSSLWSFQSHLLEICFQLTAEVSIDVLPKHSTWPRGPYKEQKPTLIHQGQNLPPLKKKKLWMHPMWPAESPLGLLECGSRPASCLQETPCQRLSRFLRKPGVTQTLPRRIALSEGCFIFLCRFTAFSLQIFKY